MSKQIELDVMQEWDFKTIAESFNGSMAIHLPDGSGIVIVTKEQAMEFFGLKENEL